MSPRVLCLLLVSILAVHANNILRSDLLVEPLAASSTISLTTFITTPLLDDDIAAETAGCFNSELFESSISKTFVIGWESFYPAFNNTSPLFSLYNGSNGQLVLSDVIFAPYDNEITDSVISPNPAVPFVATNLGIPIYPLPVNESAFVPNNYVVRVWNFNLTTGKFNQTPVNNFQMDSVDPDFYNSSVAYNGVFVVSEDGKLAVMTYAVGVYPEYITGQKHIVLAVSENGAVLTPGGSCDTAPSGIPDIYSYAQTARMWPDAHHSELYHLVVAENAWNFSYIIGSTAQVSYYRYNTTSKVLSHVVSDWTSTVIQYMDIDIPNQRIFVTGSHVDLGNGFSQIPNPYFENGASSPLENLRVWNLDTKAGTLTYAGGVIFTEDAVGVAVSSDGKLLAVTLTPLIYDNLLNTPDAPLGNPALRWENTHVELYKVSGNGQLKSAAQSAGAPPLSFCLNFDADSDQLFIAGQPTANGVDGGIVGAKDVVLLGLVDNDT